MMRSPRGRSPRCRRPFGPALVLLAALAGGCYTFSGASIPAHLATVAVPPVESRATGAPADLDQQLTEALVERFADRTRLALQPDEGAADAVVRATVESYAVAPAAVTGDATAALNRVTLRVRVVVEDRVEEGELLSRTFSATADYAPAEGLSGEADAVTRALTQVAQDAFTAATSDW